MFVITTFFIGLAFSIAFHVFPWNGLVNGITRSVSAENINALTTGRGTIWQHALQGIKGNPFFGLGPYGYILIPGRSLVELHPHNLFIQFLVEWGLIGSIIFISIIFLTVKRSSKLLFNQAFVISNCISLLLAWSIIIALTIHGLASGTYFFSQSSFYLVIAFAVIWARSADNKNLPT